MMTIVKSKKNIRVLVGSLLMSFMLTGCSSEDILVQHSMIPTSIETVYENDDVILFTALPKRIEVDGENMIELFQYQHNSLLGGCYDLKQTNKCKFDEFHFEYDNKKYYDIEDVELLLSNL